MKNKFIYRVIVALLIITISYPKTIYANEYIRQVSNSDSHILTPIATYDSGIKNEDGGVEEIVAYNSDQQTLYSVNGKTGNLDIIDLDSNGNRLDLIKSIDVKKNLEEIIKNTPYKDFKYGDMTSVDISTDLKYVAVCLQDKDYDKNGLILFLAYDGKIKRIEWAGKQPDMITFSPNSKYLLAANEGEPREGYNNDGKDPKGSVTIVRMYDENIKGSLAFNELIYPKKEDANSSNTSNSKGGLNKGGLNVSNSKKGGVNVSNSSNTGIASLNSSNSVGILNRTNTLPTLNPSNLNLTAKVPTGKKNMAVNLVFNRFDKKRDELVKKGVIIKKDTNPSVDFEPEYITIDKNSKYAYVTLQENNAIVKIDIENESFEGIYPLGFKDHNNSGNEIDLRKDKTIDIKKEKVKGIFMPDAIASYDYKGETYLVTANEGDSRQWGDYSNEIEEDGIIYFDTSDYDGFSKDDKYIFGGRSFSIWKIEGDVIYRVYDSGSNFEMATANVLGKYFNASNNNLKIDSRSPKKGPEPEGLTIGEVDGKVYAFIGLERIGGIFTYDITNPNNVIYESYINTRDFSEDIKGDVAPEGIIFINKEQSPTGKPLISAAFEVSGTVSTYEFD